MAESKPLPVVDYLKIPDDGEPYLEGYRCKKCGSHAKLYKYWSLYRWRDYDGYF